MKILHIVPSYYPAHVYGGPIESVHLLCRHLAKNGLDVRVLTTNTNGLDAVLDVETSREIEFEAGLSIRYCRRVMRHSVSPSLLRWLPAYVRWADLIHLTAVYSFPTLPTLLASRLYGQPVVWSPRGALQRWRGSRRIGQKKLWESMCRLVAPRQLVLHTTSREEAAESLKCFPAVGTTVIPNGVAIPAEVSRGCRNGELRLAFLGRLDPKKGVENLLAACGVLKRNQKTKYSLKIAGAGPASYTQALKSQIESLWLSSHVELLGEVSGEAKTHLFQTADIVIVPSHTENFGMVVAEALAHGVPVIASRGTPWNRLNEVGCGLWVDNSPNSLARAIEQMSQMPLSEMGQVGREWMQKDFSWDECAREMINLYTNLAKPR